MCCACNGWGRCSAGASVKRSKSCRQCILSQRHGLLTMTSVGCNHTGIQISLTKAKLTTEHSTQESDVSLAVRGNNCSGAATILEQPVPRCGCPVRVMSDAFLEELVRLNLIDMPRGGIGQLLSSQSPLVGLTTTTSNSQHPFPTPNCTV
jgi:hypothetical protein